MSIEKRPAAPLALREPKPHLDIRAEPWRDPDWQKFWLSMLGRTWSSLALVPASSGAPPDFILGVAVNLARIGLLHLGVPIQVADGTQIPLVHLAQFESELGRLKGEKELVLIALAPITDNPITVPLAQAADAAVLCVVLDAMSSSDAKKTVNRIGAARFLGSAVFHPSGSPDLSVSRTVTKAR
jgi:hypothetical protein